jgi:DNA repair exonuclease SbcCD ATPase subunit
LKERTSTLESEKDELESDRSELNGRIYTLQTQLSEKEYLLQNASQIGVKLREQDDHIAQIKTQLIRKEAELKGAVFTQSIFKSKMEQKDSTIIQLGQRIQSLRAMFEKQQAELRTLAEKEHQRRASLKHIELMTELTGAEIMQIIPKPEEKKQPQGYASMIAKLKEQAQMKTTPTLQRRRLIENVDQNIPLEAKPKAVRHRVVDSREIVHWIGTLPLPGSCLGEFGVQTESTRVVEEFVQALELPWEEQTTEEEQIPQDEARFEPREIVWRKERSWARDGCVVLTILVSFWTMVHHVISWTL